MIPNIVHFIWFSGPQSRQFGYINYLAVRAAYEVQKPDVIYMWCNEDIQGNPHWDAIRQYVTIASVPDIKEWNGYELYFPQHKADIHRLQSLVHHGGIYLDTDMILIKPLTPFMNEKCVIGAGGYFDELGLNTTDIDKIDSINAGLLMSEPNAEFFRRWLDRTFKDCGTESWAHNSVALPLMIYKEDPSLAHLTPMEYFLPFNFHHKNIFNQGREYLKEIKDAYSLHLWESMWDWREITDNINDEYLLTVDNAFTRLFRKYAMPTSFSTGKDVIEKIVRRVKHDRMLDIGCGSGTYAKMFPDAEWTGVEIWKPYIERYDLKSIYKNLINEDVRTWETEERFDVAIAGDVLEHMTTEDAKAVVDKLKACADTVIISIPLGYHPQDACEDNPFEAHITDNWTDEEVRRVFGEPNHASVYQWMGVYIWSKFKLDLKICVYAISKNEEMFVERFCNSAKDADMILIADTGSTDRTVELARQMGAYVPEIYLNPWRFDIARNAALSLIPKDMDVCVSLDLDEELQPGWREEIERVWVHGTTRLRYKFDWGVGIVFYYEKIHGRTGYRWHHPCHEYPVPDRITEQWAQSDMLMVIHKPDPSKSRGQYLDLLKVSVDEDPQDPRNAFYYARELSFHAKWQEAIDACQYYLNLPKANWPNERCYAMRVMSRCYAEINDYDQALSWARKAVAEAPNTREPWCEVSMLCYRIGRWEECYGAATSALRITERELVYTCDPAVWGYMAHDLAAIAAWNLGLKQSAIKHAEDAIAHDPNDVRLQNNLEMMKKISSVE
jgi:glycosyltransferase involved in cell wall biosynthesis/2-polyprenyl-3-methyl-5-hydroxy-6-metoxy-1,4-benzoquinol methylase